MRISDWSSDVCSSDLLWLNNADIEMLLDPEARPTSGLTKLWATPLVWAAARRRDNSVDTFVEEVARDEVRAKLSRFIRSRWFEPPFGGEAFTHMLLDAFQAMDKIGRAWCRERACQYV